MTTGLLIVLMALGPKPGVVVQDIAKMAEARDAAGLEAIANPELKGKFKFLTQRGAFGVGGRGWTAEVLFSLAQKQYVVFTTALTTQDYGDQIFEVEKGKIVRHIDERNLLGIRVTHADMEISFEPSVKKAYLVARTKFKKVGETGDDFFVRFGDNYDISKVTTANGSRVNFRQAGGVLNLPVGQGDEFQYDIHYSGVVDRPRFAAAIVENEAMLTNDYWWPSIGRLPISFTTKTTVPKHWRVAGMGELIGTEDKGDEKVVTYQMDMPASYLSHSAGEYGYQERTVNGRQYHIWSNELNQEEMAIQLELFPPVLEFFDGIARYPFSGFGAVDSKLYGGGALEAYSFATYGSGWLPDEDAHEPSHTWFGGILPNTYLDSFWNESFAVFCEGLYAREGKIGRIEEKRLAFVSNVRTSNVYKRHAASTTGAEDGPAASAMGYGFGGAALQQLEYEMGHEAMMDNLRLWLQNRVPGEPVDWRDFQRVCGARWDWFFNQWIHEPGYPEFAIEDVTWINGFVTGALNFESKPYRLKMEVWVDGKLESFTVRPREGQTRVPFRFRVAKKPKMISVDPYDRLIGPAKPRLPERLSESRRMELWVEKGAEAWAEGMRRSKSGVPENLEGKFIIADPATSPTMKKLCDMAGFKVSGSILSWDGTSIDLRNGVAMAMVEFEPGKWCCIQLGKSVRRPSVGKASVALTDGYGRFLRGKTYPRMSGPMVFEIP